MKTLIIARHGNTFAKGETPTRVGCHTDLPLVEEERGRGVGLYLKKLGLVPTRILAAPLKRTMGTAALAAEAAGCKSFSMTRGKTKTNLFITKLEVLRGAAAE